MKSFLMHLFKSFAGLIVLSFVFVSFLTLRVAVDLAHPEIMADCPLMENSSSFCAMNGLQQLTDWQKLFSFEFQKGQVLLMLVISLGFFLLHAAREFVLQENDFLLHRLRLHQRLREVLEPFNAWAQWLFGGLLHPVVYQKVKA